MSAEQLRSIRKIHAMCAELGSEVRVTIAARVLHELTGALLEAWGQLDGAQDSEYDALHRLRTLEEVRRWPRTGT